MAGIVNNPHVFILIKLIGISVIIMILSKVYNQNRKVAHTGMRLLIIMMLFVVGNNLYIISANAVPFASMSGTSGDVGNGNGYFSSESSFFNTTGSVNIYIITEPTKLGIVEPISHALGTSGIYDLIYNGGGQTLRFGMVASDGCLYFVDSEGIKKRKSRSTSIFLSDDTTEITGNLILLYASANVYTLYEYSGSLYFIDGTAIKSLRLSDYVSTTNVPVVGSGIHSPLAVTSISGVTTYFYMGNKGSGQTMYLKKYTTSENATFYPLLPFPSFGGAGLGYGSIFLSSNYIYANAYYYDDGSNNGATEKILYRNGTLKSSNYYNSGLPYSLTQDINLGGFSSIGLYKASASTYDTISYSELGIYNAPSTSAILTYSLQSVNSVYPTYYNNSVFSINEQVAYTANASQTTQYSHRVDLYAPDGGVIGTKYLMRACETIGGLDWLLDPNHMYQCVATAKSIDINLFMTNPTLALADALNFQFANGNPWVNGTYTVKLIEAPTEAILDTDSFIVLNITGQLTTTPPTGQDITTGTSPISIGLVDGFVGMLGMGVNSVTKLLFALIIIALAMMAGFVATKGQVFGGVIIGLVPYLFFTFIEYLPAWGVVILGIVVAIKIGFFR